MRKQDTKSGKRSLWSRVFGSIFGSKPRTISNNPQWAGFTPQNLARCEARIRRLRHEYLTRYRNNGNLHLPEIYEVDASAVYTRCDAGTTEITIQQAADSLSREEIDILMRSILMQLMQLESIGYIHSALTPNQLIIRQRQGIWRAEIIGLEHGHFTDETIGIPISPQSNYLSPEGCRRRKYTAGNSVQEISDIFSAGCIYYYLLTGKELEMPAESLLRMQPLCVSGTAGPYSSLIRWMLEQNEVKRPTASDVMAVMDEIQKLGLLQKEWKIGKQIQLEKSRVTGQQISPEHEENQLLVASRDGQTLMIRCMTDYWNPGKQQNDGSILAYQQRIYDWNVTRLQLVSKRSEAWHRKYPLIIPAKEFTDGLWPVMAAPLRADAYITLSELRQYNSSIFLLDARMTEILFALQVLHDDRFMLGPISPTLFGVSIDGEIAQTELLDLSGAISLDDLPQPGAIMPSPEATQLLSPELAQYIVFSAKEGTEELLNMQEWMGPASDIFSMGLIYHLILTGRLPKLIRQEHGSYANAICNEACVQDAIELDQSIDSKHAELIYSMLRMNPLERPIRCDEIICRILDFYTA